MHSTTTAKIRRERDTSFAKNVMMLAVAQIVVKVLGLIYKIIIVNIPGFGDTGNGYYSAGYQLYMVLLAISSIGIPNVVSKMVSERVAVGDYRGAHRVFSVTFRMFSLIGFLLAAGLYLFADGISVALFGAKGVSYTLKALSPAVLFVSSNAVLRGYFTGLGSLKSTSISEIIEQTFNCLLSVLFVYMVVGKDTAIMAAAGNLSTSVAALVSVGYMLSHYLLRRRYLLSEAMLQKVPGENVKTLPLIKTVLGFAIPAAFASLVSTLSSNIDSITVNQYTGNVEAYGVLSKTETLTHLPLALSATLFVAIVPVISAMIKTEDYRGARDKLSNTLFLSLVIILPCAMGFIVLADPILKLLYPAVSDGALLLQLQTVAMIFAAITFVFNGVFYGLGQQKHAAVILLLGSALKLLLNLLFLDKFKMGVTGAAVATIIYQILVTAVEGIVLNRYVKVRLKFIKQFLNPMIATGIMGALVFLIYKVLIRHAGNTVSTLLAILGGVVVYFITLLALGTLSHEDYLQLPMGEKIYRLLKKLHLAR